MSYQDFGTPALSCCTSVQCILAFAHTHMHRPGPEADVVITAADKKADSMRAFVNDVSAMRLRIRAAAEGAIAKRGAGSRGKAKALPKKEKRHIAKLPEAEDIGYMSDLLPPGARWYKGDYNNCYRVHYKGETKARSWHLHTSKGAAVQLLRWAWTLALDYGVAQEACPVADLVGAEAAAAS